MNEQFNLGISYLDVATIVCSVYVLIESLIALFSMPRGYVLLCTKTKYVLAFASSLAFIYYAAIATVESMQWLLLGSSATLSLFVWPRMVWRFHHALDQLEICLNETHD